MQSESNYGFFQRHLPTSQNEDIWCQEIRDLRSRIKYSLMSIQKAVNTGCFLVHRLGLAESQWQPQRADSQPQWCEPQGQPQLVEQQVELELPFRSRTTLLVLSLEPTFGWAGLMFVTACSTHQACGQFHPILGKAPDISCYPRL